jgi:hypothetical protein
LWFRWAIAAFLSLCSLRRCDCGLNSISACLVLRPSALRGFALLCVYVRAHFTLALAQDQGLMQQRLICTLDGLIEITKQITNKFPHWLFPLFFKADEQFALILFLKCVKSMELSISNKKFD